MKKSVIFILLFSLVGILVNIIRYWPDGRLHIAFCDVGQGDAIYIRFPTTTDMLIDGGPRNGKVLECLSSNMPFYDRNLEVVMLTHPQNDHLGGLVDVINRYKLSYFIAPPVGNSTNGYRELMKSLKEKNVLVKNLYSGAKIRFGEANIDVLWPDRKWTALNVKGLNNGVVLGASTREDLNNFSIISRLSYGSFDALFTGDAEAGIQKRMEDSGMIASVDIVDSIEILKVPHHGAKNGLLDSFLDNIQPKLAVISVGRNNRYGHPSAEILDKLNQRHVQILRTDRQGTVKIVSDGTNWWVK